MKRVKSESKVKGTEVNEKGFAFIRKGRRKVYFPIIGIISTE